MTDFGREDVEESNAKCHVCSAGLTYIEHKLYGNRCVFCAEEPKNIKLIEFMQCCYYDWKIYQKLLKLRAYTDGRMTLLGALGVIGLVDINQAKTVKQKRWLLKELKGVCK